MTRPDFHAAGVAADPSNASRVADLLLPHLRAATEAPDLRYVDPPRSIVVGVETWVYGLELAGGPPEFTGAFVLRVFPPETAPHQVRFEEIVQNTINDLGYPAPRVPFTCTDASAIGGPFLLMARMAGQMMLDAIGNETVGLGNAPRLILDALRDVPETLVRTQLWLHRLDPEPLCRSLERGDVPKALYTVEGWIDRIDACITDAAIAGLRPAMDWVKANRPAASRKPVICHGDFLPPNIMIEDGEVSGVIDWSHVTIAPPEWDIACTRLRIAYNPFPIPAFLKPIARVLRPVATRRYDRAYKRERTVDERVIQYHEVLVGLWLLLGVAEHRLAGEPATANDGRTGNPWFARGSTRPLIRYMQRITNTAITLPPGMAG